MSDRERAAEHAIKIAWELERPVIAQSLPPATVQSRFQLKGMLLFGCYILAAAFVVPVAGALGGIWWLLGALVLAVAGGWQISHQIRAWVTENSDFVDAEIRVAVDSSGILVSAPSGEHLIAFDAVEASLSLLRSDESVSFRGMKIETPIGLLALDDDGFDRGRDAAATIVQEMAWAREARQRAKQERML